MTANRCINSNSASQNQTSAESSGLTSLGLNTRVPSSWAARLRLKIEKTSRGSRLVTNEHIGPLYVQKPFYVEGHDLPHIYLLHPPGGLVSGDNLSIDIHTADHASALFTAPGAARIYRARPDRSLQEQTTSLSLGQSASVEWLPQESIFYPDSLGKLKTRIQLPSTGDIAGFIGWEISCFGLSQNTAPFTRGFIDQSFEIWRGDIPEFIERQKFNAQNSLIKYGKAGFQDKTVSALMVSGPFNAPMQESAAFLEQVQTVDVPQGVLFASTLRGRWLVTRYLGSNAEQARKLLTSVWAIVRPNLLKREIMEPRIWAC